ncbi:hypothetical protein FWF93_02945 [Candidatus Saccharibacteria bacterium]|nr:hypothetical protein [Candidatus Saccharibacteria bacterium]
MDDKKSGWFIQHDDNNAKVKVNTDSGDTEYVVVDKSTGLQSERRKMKNSQINEQLKHIIDTCDNIEASNRIVPFLCLNFDDEPNDYEEILNLALNAESPGRYPEEERLEHYKKLKEKIFEL